MLLPDQTEQPSAQFGQCLAAVGAIPVAAFEAER